MGETRYVGGERRGGGGFLLFFFCFVLFFVLFCFSFIVFGFILCFFFFFFLFDMNKKKKSKKKTITTYTHKKKTQNSFTNFIPTVKPSGLKVSRLGHYLPHNTFVFAGTEEEAKKLQDHEFVVGTYTYLYIWKVCLFRFLINPFSLLFFLFLFFLFFFFFFLGTSTGLVPATLCISFALPLLSILMIGLPEARARRNKD